MRGRPDSETQVLNRTPQGYGILANPVLPNETLLVRVGISSADEMWLTGPPDSQPCANHTGQSRYRLVDLARQTSPAMSNVHKAQEDHRLPYPGQIPRR